MHPIIYALYRVRTKYDVVCGPRLSRCHYKPAPTSPPPSLRRSISKMGKLLLLTTAVSAGLGYGLHALSPAHALC